MDQQADILRGEGRHGYEYWVADQNGFILEGYKETYTDEDGWCKYWIKFEDFFGRYQDWYLEMRDRMKSASELVESREIKRRKLILIRKQALLDRLKAELGSD